MPNTVKYFITGIQMIKALIRGNYSDELKKSIKGFSSSNASIRFVVSPKNSQSPTLEEKFGRPSKFWVLKINMNILKMVITLLWKVLQTSINTSNCSRESHYRGHINVSKA